jgi:hypothetical protein
MALDASNVRVAVTGAVYADITASATAPTSSTSSLDSDLKDLGYVSEDGITLSLPGGGDSQAIHAWQNGATVRTVRTPSDDNPQLSLTLIETKLEVVEFVFGVEVDDDVADGSFVFDTTTGRTHAAVVIDVIDDDQLVRIYAPRAIVAEINEVSLTHTDAIGYGVTLDLERDADAGYNFKTWMTALGTGS